MAQNIKNMSQLVKALEPKIIATLELVAEDVKHEIDTALDEYYSEYKPLYYHRTDQLRNCCKIGKPKIINGNIGIEVYLDISSLKYRTKGADPYKTIRAGDSGLHGGIDPSNPHGGQVPWSIVGSGNIGDRYGSGTRIWSEPIEELIDNGKLITIFKKCAKQRGLNIR